MDEIMEDGTERAGMYIRGIAVCYYAASRSSCVTKLDKRHAPAKAVRRGRKWSRVGRNDKRKRQRDQRMS